MSVKNEEWCKNANQELNKYADWRGAVTDYDYFSGEGGEIFFKVKYQFSGADHDFRFVVIDGPSIFPTIATELKKRGHAS